MTTRTAAFWQFENVQTMKTKLCIGIFLLAAVFARAQTNSLANLLQQGLFEEQASRNYEAAIADYQNLAAQFDKDRQLAATAVFRLGECYRALGRTNEAIVQYQRILHDFADQQTLAGLSRQDLTGMGFAEIQVPAKGTVGGISPGQPIATVSDPEDAEILRIQQMIQNSPDLINLPKPLDFGRTPLTKAADAGQLKVAAYLLDHGADVNGTATQPTGGRGADQIETPLLAAVGAGNKAMAQFLIDHGANVNFNQGYLGETPLQLAARKGFQAVIQVLLASHAEINARDHNGTTPLFSAVASGQIKIVQMLLAAGADPNQKDNQGRTVLNFAIRTSPEMMKALLDGGAKPNTEDILYGRTPLSYAAERDSSAVVKLLLDAKADPNAGHCDPPLFSAIEKKDAASVEQLLLAGADPKMMGHITWPYSIDRLGYGNSSPPNANDPPLSPLFYAILKNDLSLVQLLLKFHADPNDTRTDGKSLLFSALNKPDILKALLDAGGNANASDETGLTVLHYAVIEAADESVFTELFNHQAVPNVRDNNGDTPLDILKRMAQSVGSGSDRQKQAKKLITLLREHGARDVLPDWNHITVSRPAANFFQPLLPKNTNNWNQFTLLEALYQQGLWNPPSQLNFPDLSHVVITRPATNGQSNHRIVVNLLDGTNGVDCSRDVPLEFGDVVEIPEREHALSETPAYLRRQEQLTILNHFRDQAGTATLMVPGAAPVQLPLQPFYAQIGRVLQLGTARAALTSNCDLAHVRVIRDIERARNPHPIKYRYEWIIDCSKGGNDGVADLWLRAGDVIEVSLKP